MNNFHIKKTKAFGPTIDTATIETTNLPKRFLIILSAIAIRIRSQNYIIKIQFCYMIQAHHHEIQIKHQNCFTIFFLYAALLKHTQRSANIIKKFSRKAENIFD